MVAVTAVTMTACANKGIGPQGGPKDETAPELVREIPENGTTGWNGKKVTVAFNEYLQLDNIAQNVLISPPLPHQPDIKAVGKRVVVTFKDSLRENTTYTIEFGRAICDYHEKNPVAGYSYSFATGEAIDTLEAYGTVYHARTLNPVVGAIVGIHRNLNDSAIETEQFTRIAKTDSTGQFAIHNIAEGHYRYYALMDGSSDYRYQPGEAIAYDTAVIHPYLWEEERLDSVWTYDEDSVRVLDHIDTYIDTWAEPGDLTLWMFEEDKTRQYFQRALREDRRRITLLFGNGQRKQPQLEADWLSNCLIQYSQRYDTVQIWLRDTILIARDTLPLLITYERSDSLFNLETTTDTINAVYRQPRMTERAKAAAAKKEANRRLTLSSNGNTKFNVYDTLRIHFDYPVDTLHTEQIQLFRKQDSIWVDQPIRIVAADSSQMQYLVLSDLKPDNTYELRYDSACARDIYSKVCDKGKVSIKLRDVSEYATLNIDLRRGHHQGRIILELLDEKDEVVRTLLADGEKILFRHLEPKTYGLRAYIDSNEDGKWTTGDWAKKRQPEPVFYFPKMLTLKANWDFEERFSLPDAPNPNQKPQPLIKVWDGKEKKK